MHFLFLFLDKPILSFGPYNPLRVIEGEAVTLTCNIDAFPAVTNGNIRWEKNGVFQGKKHLTCMDGFRCYGDHVDLFGLSKERPILGDHAKAHIFGFRSENTLIKPRRSTWKAHEKCKLSAWKAYAFRKTHLQGIVTLCFNCWKVTFLDMLLYSCCHDKFGILSFCRWVARLPGRLCCYERCRHEVKMTSHFRHFYFNTNLTHFYKVEIYWPYESTWNNFEDLIF